MFTTILCCTDGSVQADQALRAATDLAVHENAHLHLVHVEEKLIARHPAGQDASLVEPEILTKIQAQAAEITARETRCQLHITSARVGHVAERIAETAADTESELIVVATRGHSALGSLLLGSVTQRLLEVSPCPVLAIPPGAQVVRGQRPQPAGAQTAAG
jgi:nucleotide-binding universal stress UspA family protein